MHAFELVVERAKYLITPFESLQQQLPRCVPPPLPVVWFLTATCDPSQARERLKVNGEEERERLGGRCFDLLTGNGGDERANVGAR